MYMYMNYIIKDALQLKISVKRMPSWQSQKSEKPELRFSVQSVSQFLGKMIQSSMMWSHRFFHRILTVFRHRSEV